MFKIELQGNRIVMSGELTADPQMRGRCFGIAKLAGVAGRKWIVDAQALKLHAAGETHWRDAVSAFLGECELVYLPSPLAMNLQYDDEYRHTKSRFLDTDDELEKEGGGE